MITPGGDMTIVFGVDKTNIWTKTQQRLHKNDLKKNWYKWLEKLDKE